MGDRVNTRVLVIESSDKGDGFTPVVDLIMDGTLGEDGSLTLSQCVDDKASAVLLDEPGIHRAVNEKQELGRSGMGVGGVHSARSGERFALC